MTFYSDKLLDPRWDEKRLLILKRDEYCCMGCGRSKRLLHVHHSIYIEGREPWEYRGGDLVTLCEPCHDRQHDFDGSAGQVARGSRATIFPNNAKQLGELIGSLPFMNGVTS